MAATAAAAMAAAVTAVAATAVAAPVAAATAAVNQAVQGRTDALRRASVFFHRSARRTVTRIRTTMSRIITTRAD
jgi:hypothetical protein